MGRNYSNTAVTTTLSGAINAVATSITVASTTGFPAVDFILALEPGTANQELVLVTGVAGSTLTVTRGYDNTTAVAHSTGATVQHSHAARDFKDSRDHEVATVAHGATGAVVGTTNAQTLTNKTLTLAGNTISGTKAQFNTAMSDDDFATLGGTETLVNKTLVSPSLVTPVIGGSTFTPPKSGSLSSGTFPGVDTDVTVAVSFGTTFPSVPHVSATVEATSAVNNYAPVVSNISTTGCSITVARKVGTVAVTIHWVATV